MASLTEELYGKPENSGLTADLYGESPRQYDPKTKRGALEDFAINAFEGAGNMAAGALKGASNIGSTILSPFDAAARATGADNAYFGPSGQILGRNDRRQAVTGGLSEMGADTNSIPYKAGEFGAEVAGTLGIGGPAVKMLGGLKYAPKLAEAITTAGFKGGNLATRMAGGAINSGASSLLIDDNYENAGAAAGFGAAVPLVSPLFKQGAKLTGYLSDLLTGNGSAVEAGKIARKLAGSDLAEITAKNAVAPDSLTAAQAAYGVKNAPYMALGEFAERKDPSTYFYNKRVADEAADLARMQAAVGADTATGARKTAAAMKDAVSGVTVPAMGAHKALVNEAGDTARMASNLREGAETQVENVRRISLAQQKADELAQRGQMNLAAESSLPAQGLPRISGKYSFPGELSGQGERASQVGNRATQQAADKSLELGAGARAAEARLAELEAQGIRPIDGNSIIANINRIIESPSVRGSALNRQALGKVSSEIEREIAVTGGMPNATVLHDIRKTAINDAIDSLTSGMKQKAKDARAAGLLAQVKPEIDKAFGPEWTSIMDAHAAGMRAVERQKMNAELMKMLKENPKAFIKTVRGENPKLTEKIFGAGNFDIAEAMGKELGTAQGISETLARDRSISKMADAGLGSLASSVGINSNILPTLPGFLSVIASTTNKVIDAIEQKLDKKTLEILINGMKTGKNANDMMAVLPAAERNNALLWLSKGGPEKYLTSTAAAAQQ